MALSQHTMTVSRTAHYSVLGDPGSGSPESWFVCHGYGQLAHRFLRRFEPLESSDRLVVAPEGLSRYYVRGSNGVVGASWMTREDREIEIGDYLGYLDGLAGKVLTGATGVHPDVVLGFSQGCATASRWAARGACRPRFLVLWAELPAHDLTDDDFASLARKGTRVMLVAGREDPYLSLDAVARAEKELESHGLSVQTLPFDGGHEIVEAPLLDLAGRIAER